MKRTSDDFVLYQSLICLWLLHVKLIHIALQFVILASRLVKRPERRLRLLNNLFLGWLKSSTCTLIWGQRHWILFLSTDFSVWCDWQLPRDVPPGLFVFICHHHGNCHFLFNSWKTSEIPYIIFSKASFHFLYKQPLVSFVWGKLVQLITSKLQLAVLWPDNSIPHFPQLLFNCITLKSANIFAQWIQWAAKFDKCCQCCLLQKGIRLTSLIQSCCQLMIQCWGMNVWVRRSKSHLTVAFPEKWVTH